MTVTRRKFVAKSSILVATTALAGTAPSVVWATSRLALGDVTIDVLSDGRLTLPGSFMFDGMPERELGEILGRFGLSRDQVTPDCNLTLVRDGKRTILFDVGAGPNFQPTAGKLSEAMEAQNIAPDDVTHVVFTHAHPDHLWGLLDEFDDPLFPNAHYMIGKAEWDYWIDPATVQTIGAERQAFAVGAARRLKAMEERMTFFRAGEEILPGVHARDTTGHTPGHMSFEIRSGSNSVMIIGDAVTNIHVAFEKPQWLSGSDQDRELGAKTRVLLLDQLAAEKMQIIGYHMPFPGIGYVEKKDSGFRFIAS
ncbi:MAG: MBL fold metallo-hydrolase [Hyphomicrobiaceae bacterium]